MRPAVRLAAAASLGLLAVVGLAPAASAAPPTHVDWIRVDGTINPASADFIEKSIQRAAGDGAQALLVQLDTPGGLLASTKDIIQAMLNARVPVIVYVAPQGAWAGSAGTYITIAAHIAAMAPGTSIGAAHPVGIGGSGGEKKGGGKSIEGQKIENMMAAYMESIAKERHRNVEWAVRAVRQSVAVPADEALRLHVIDLIATSRAQLLEKLDGRRVALASGERTLATADAELREFQMPAVSRFLSVLANPDVALVLLLAGLLGLYVEFTHPGVLVPGIAGGICLLLGAISLQILPFSWLGLLVLLAGIGFLVAELFLTSFGVLFVLGVVCLLVGGALLFDLPAASDLRVSFWGVLVPAVAGMALFVGLVLFAVGRSFGRRPTAGVDALVGLSGRAETALAPEGTVFVRGEYWAARAETNVSAGERVEVVAVEGMKLRVRRQAAEV